jgi:ABC-type sugar transport system permease subunit
MHHAFTKKTVQSSGEKKFNLAPIDSTQRWAPAKYVFIPLMDNPLAFLVNLLTANLLTFFTFPVS